MANIPISSTIPVYFKRRDSFETSGSTNDWFITTPTPPLEWGQTTEVESSEIMSPSRLNRKGEKTSLTSGSKTINPFGFDIVERFFDAMCYNPWSTPIIRGTMSLDPTAGFVFGRALTAQERVLYGGTAMMAKLFHTGYYNDTAVDNKYFVGPSAAIAQNAVTVTSTGLSSAISSAVAPSAFSTFQLAGVRIAANQLDISSADSAARTCNLVFDSVDPGDLSLSVGQWIYIGGEKSGTPRNNFSTTSSGSDNAIHGKARIRQINGQVLALERCDATLVSQASATKSSGVIDILISRFVRNIDDTDAKFQRIFFEQEVENKGQTSFEHVENAMLQSATLNFPAEALATIDLSFLSTDTDNPSATRVSDANPTPIARLQDISTSLGLRDVSFYTSAGEMSTIPQEFSITIDNKPTAVKKLTQLAAANITYGKLMIELDIKGVFDVTRTVGDIKANETGHASVFMSNPEGALIIDVHNMDLSGGKREYPPDDAIKIDWKGKAFEVSGQPTLGFSLFPGDIS